MIDPGLPGSELGVGLQQHPAKGRIYTDGFNIPAGRKNMKRPSKIKDSRVGTQTWGLNWRLFTDNVRIQPLSCYLVNIVALVSKQTVELWLIRVCYHSLRFSFKRSDHVLPVTCDLRVCFSLSTVYGIDCLVMNAIRQLLRHACFAGQSDSILQSFFFSLRI
jgi:hypothetical protein